jgi:hypothetical protein
MDLTDVEQQLLLEFQKNNQANEQNNSSSIVHEEKKRKTHGKPTHFIPSPPKKCRRRLPDPSADHKTKLIDNHNNNNNNNNTIENQNVVRYILNNLEQGVAFSDFLPLKKGYDIDNIKGTQPLEEFPELDEETAKEVEALYNTEIQEFNEARILAQERNEVTDEPVRPSSPGKEYDSLYMPDEIGMRKPRFKANVLEEIFKHDKIKTGQFEKIMSSAKNLEHELKETHSKRYQSHDAIVKHMLQEMKKTKAKR